MSGVSLADAVKAIAAKALVTAFGRTSAQRCLHDDVRGYTFVNGKTAHCKCGFVLKIKCMHVKVEQLLPRVFQCVDCKETRGMGSAE